MATETGNEEGRERGRRRVEVGVVTSDKMDKTAVITIDRATQHPLYKKVVRKSKKYLAHDEDDTCRVGDRVKIVEDRPRSRRKRWRVVEVIERAPGS